MATSNYNVSLFNFFVLRLLRTEAFLASQKFLDLFAVASYYFGIIQAKNKNNVNIKIKK